MCDFCDALRDNSKEITWHVRSTYADNNINEYLDSSQWRCTFKLSSYFHNGKTHVGVDYREEISIDHAEFEKIIISPFSEMIQFNFCPICGKQISDHLKDFDSYHLHQISIDDK